MDATQELSTLTVGEHKLYKRLDHLIVSFAISLYKRKGGGCI